MRNRGALHSFPQTEPIHLFPNLIMRTQAPRGITLFIALLLWLLGAAEMLAGVKLPYDVGQWCLLLAGALLFLGCLIRGL
jgi:uncharacterized membrane protein HdeD (DUF308 family)